MRFASFLSGGFITAILCSKPTWKETGKSHLCAMFVCNKVRTYRQCGQSQSKETCILWSLVCFFFCNFTRLRLNDEKISIKYAKASIWILMQQQ